MGSEKEKSTLLKPVTCDVNLYPYCMFKCKMCLIWDKNSIPKDLRPIPFESMSRLIKSLAEFTDKKIFLDFIGGEPLMRSDIIDLIKISTSHGLTTTTCTNGYLLDMDMVKRLYDTGLNRLSISLDGRKEQTHDMIRAQPGSYSRIMQALEYLSKFTSFDSENFRICIQTIIMRYNLKEIIDLAHWVNNSDVISSINYMAVSEPFFLPAEVSTWYKHPYYQDLWPQDKAEVHAVIDELIRLKTQEGHLKIVNPIPQLKAFKPYFENPERFVKKVSCGYHNFALNVNYNGDVTFCYRLGTIGNIYESDIKDMWYSDKANQLREKIKKCDKNCNFLINCSGLDIRNEDELIV